MASFLGAKTALSHPILPKSFLKSRIAAKLRLSASSATSAPPTIVEVDLGSRSYPIYIGSGLLDQPDLLQRHVHGKKILVVTNTTVAPLYLDKTISALTEGNPYVTVESMILPDGEKYKNMVDSSVGGKTGINHRLGKNLIGTIYQPQGVVIDTDTLNTLPERELASGLSEVIKLGLIRDAKIFEWQEQNLEALLSRDPDAFADAIKHSCENKAEVVSLDEWESGVRLTLNLGHTFGHAIETSFGYGQWLHGEAIAAGTVMAVDMSYLIGWIEDSLVQRVHRILKQANLPTLPPDSMTVEMFKSVVDKKVADGLLRLILLKGPLGSCVFTGDYDRNALGMHFASHREAGWHFVSLKGPLGSCVFTAIMIDTLWTTHCMHFASHRGGAGCHFVSYVCVYIVCICKCTIQRHLSHEGIIDLIHV